MLMVFGQTTLDFIWSACFGLLCQFAFFLSAIDYNRKLGPTVVLHDTSSPSHPKHRKKKRRRYTCQVQRCHYLPWLLTLWSSISRFKPPPWFGSTPHLLPDPPPISPYFHHMGFIAASNFNQVYNSTIGFPSPLPVQVQNIDDFKSVYFPCTSSTENAALPIVFDTGASTSVSPVRDDFLGELLPSKVHSLHGLQGEVPVLGCGTVSWPIVDKYGVIRTIKTKAHYVPSAQIRLFSPQVYFAENNTGECLLNKDEIRFTIADGSVLHFPYHGSSNIPLMFPHHQTHVGLTHHDVSLLSSPQHVSTFLSVADELNQNLTAAQKELLTWHWRLGHANMKWVQALFANHHTDDNRADFPILKSKHPKVSSCALPLCVACQVAKQTRRGPGTQATTQVPNTEMMIRRDNVDPGKMVSIDQYISSVPGRRAHTKGKEAKKDRFVGGTIFVDHASGFIYVQHMLTLRAGDTVNAKRSFEQYAGTHGVKILGYHADNVPFGSREFREALQRHDQVLLFSGTGAHHQNGVAERAIRTISSWTRAMLLHMVMHWPAQADLSLWPFAMDYAVHIWNNFPKPPTLLSPVEIFSRSKFPSSLFLNRCRVWGCPAYVLDPALQDGKKLPKWQPRARRGQFLGFSVNHSSTVGCILNLVTGYISPQYHVVYDNLFTTVFTFAADDLYDATGFTPAQWGDLLLTGYDRHDDFDEDDAPVLADEWLSPAERAERDRLSDLRHRRRHALRYPPIAPEGAPVPPAPRQVTFDLPPAPVPLAPEGVPVPLPLPPVPLPLPPVPLEPPLSPEGVRRSARVSTRNRRYVGNEWVNYQVGVDARQKVRTSCLNSCFINSLNWDFAVDSFRSSDFAAMMTLFQDHTDVLSNTVEWMHPMILAAKMNSEDTPNWNEAMSGPNKQGFWQAMVKEVNTLQIDKDAWDIIDREPWMNVLSSTWAFRCKRFPDGLVRKLKARFCVRGDQQVEGVDFFDTFAPVINWTTVRIMLILSIILELSTKQVDYTCAFLHAPIDQDPRWNELSEEEQLRSGVYVNMPRGFTQPGKVLKLKKSLYGLKQAPRNFFLFLKDKLESVGFTSMEDLDPCLFVSDRVICLVYVDDTLFYSPKAEFIDEIIAKLKQNGMDLEVEGEVAGFLGVHINRDHQNNTVTLTQAGLTKRIIEALDIEHLPPKRTPATAVPLTKDEDGDPADGVYNYSSVVGMLQYLQNHSRPDITYAVSQCARFVHSPRRSHETALEQLGQYLKGTVEEGLVLTPTGKLSIDCFVDADFAGLWPHEDKSDPICVKSRSGYVICLSDCPVIWCSKLQHLIATSTMEAEYNALSIAMREVLPFKRLVQAVSRSMGYTDDEVTTFALQFGKTMLVHLPWQIWNLVVLHLGQSFMP